MTSVACLPDRQSDLSRGDVLYLIGCASYPIWWLLTPKEAYDPWWVWALLGLTIVASGIASFRFRPTHVLAHHRIFGFAFVVHLHWLVPVNPGQLFYLEALRRMMREGHRVAYIECAPSDWAEVDFHPDLESMRRQVLGDLDV